MVTLLLRLWSCLIPKACFPALFNRVEVVLSIDFQLQYRRTSKRQVGFLSGRIFKSDFVQVVKTQGKSVFLEVSLKSMVIILGSFIKGYRRLEHFGAETRDMTDWTTFESKTKHMWQHPSIAMHDPKKKILERSGYRV